MKIIKYQSGGSSISYLPVINPVNAGAPSAPAAQEPQKESSVVEDTVKELFKARGLKSDHDVLMNYIESGSRAIGLENVLSSKLTTIMSYINNMAVAKEEYINAENHLQTIKGTYETAVTSKGGVFVFDVNTVYKHQEVLGNNCFVYESGKTFCAWQNSLDKDGGKRHSPSLHLLVPYYYIIQI